MRTILAFVVLMRLVPEAFTGAQVTIEEYAPGSDPIRFNWPTHIAFRDGLEIVTDLRNDRLAYRETRTRPFIVSPIELKGPHSVVFNRDDGLYYVNDTERHRMAAFANLGAPKLSATARKIAGVQLQRPHDQVHDTDTGWLYAINPNRPTVFRFRSLGHEESHLDLDDVLDYSRALTLVDGVLYVVGSSQGAVVAIHDFETASYSLYRSSGKKVNAPAGNWEKTGLVLNDIAFHRGFWYASSYFTPAYSDPNQDYDRNKLIRFETWQDFESGTWEDLSELLPTGIVPYFFSSDETSLFLAAFYHGNQPEDGRDAIFRITTHPPG